MLVMRPPSPRHHGLAEIERPRRPRRVGKAGGDLVDALIGEGGVVLDHRREGGDVGFRIGEPGERDAHRRRVEQRQIALHVYHRVVRAAGVQARDRLMDAVRAGRQPRIGQHRPPTGGDDRFGDFRVAAGDDDRPRFGRNRPAPDMDDHRGPADQRQRLARKPRRGQACRNENDRVRRGGSGHGCSIAGSWVGRQRQHARFGQSPEA